MSLAKTAKTLPWSKGLRLVECDANGLLAVDKPTGVLSHPNKKGDVGKALLNAPYDAEQQAYVLEGENEEATKIYLLNRLDSATSGLVLLSLDEEVKRLVAKAFEDKKVRKVYHALVFGASRKKNDFWKDRLSIDRKGGVNRAKAGPSGALQAETRLVAAKPIPGPPLTSLLTLEPLTGRTHQLRIQSSKRNLPIVGDRTYGDFRKNKSFGKGKGAKRLYLHCSETSLQYTMSGRKHRFTAKSACPFL